MYTQQTAIKIYIKEIKIIYSLSETYALSRVKRIDRL